ncbi:hypothetical protein [Paraburkholderia sp. J11-2]|uniref:hypothetical protein n=1 Tax=Paraburkholderia sp. J11-2 TaxID=2805431 RepID=UPI002AB75EBB|nr:hypothetical protein [Paraburkholderia sp. J11-2]
MTLADLIYKKRRMMDASASVANPANHEFNAGQTVSEFSDLSISSATQIDLPDETNTASVDEAKSECESSSGLFLPWGPYLSADDVIQLRGELVGMIERLSNLERWPHSTRDAIVRRAIYGPLADLLPNIAHFRERVEAAQANAAAFTRWSNERGT